LPLLSTVRVSVVLVVPGGGITGAGGATTVGVATVVVVVSVEVDCASAVLTAKMHAAVPIIKTYLIDRSPEIDIQSGSVHYTSRHIGLKNSAEKTMDVKIASSFL
jgi:hypothetical protein